MTALSTDRTTASDRDELIEIARAYMAGLESRDLKRAPLAADVVMTENARPVGLGDPSLVEHFEGFQYPRQYVADVVTGEIGVQAAIRDGVGDALLALRLKVVGGAITEVETLLSHEGESGPAFEPAGFRLRESPFIAEIPTNVRTPRTELLRIAENYWTVATTTHAPESVDFTLNCFHIENGMNTDWEHIPGGDGYFESKAFAPQADGRRFKCSTDLELSTQNWTGLRSYRALADEERGLVMSWNMVDAVREGAPFAPMSDAATAASAFQTRLEQSGFGMDDVPPGLTPRGMVAAPGPFTIYHAETQRIIAGEIDRQQVFMHLLPAAAASPW